MNKQFFLGIILGVIIGLIISNPFLTVNSSRLSFNKHSFDNHLTLQLPDSARVIQSDIQEGGQLQYSIYLDDQSLLLRGYIQLWKLDNLEGYLVNSRKISTFDFHSYTLEPVKVANSDGYLNEWTASFGESYKISGIEYWLPKAGTNEILRISFFTDASKFTVEQKSSIDKIINSIEYNG